MALTIQDSRIADMDSIMSDQFTLIPTTSMFGNHTFVTSDRGLLFDRDPALLVPLEFSFGANVQCSTTSRSSVESEFVATFNGFM